MWKKTTIVIAFIIAIVGYNTSSAQDVGAPSVSYHPNVNPISDSTYEIGTSTRAWLRGTFDELCLTADDCKTTWPSGSVFAWTPTGYGVSTSTTLGFTQGFLSSASSTITDVLHADGTIDFQNLFVLDAAELSGTQRLRVQGTGANDPVEFLLQPKGSSNSAIFSAINSSNLNNFGDIELGIDANRAFLHATSSGNGTTPPIDIVVDGTDIARFDTTGNIGIGTTSPIAKLSVTNTGSGPSFVVEDSASPDSTPTEIDASGNFTSGGDIAVAGHNNWIGIGTDTDEPYFNFRTDNQGMIEVKGARFYDVETDFYRVKNATLEAWGNINMKNDDFQMIADGSSSGTTAQSAGTIRLRNRYWDGDSSNDHEFEVRHIQDDNGATSQPTSRVKFSFDNTDNHLENEALTLLSEGRVGIGTTSPYAKLSVVGETVSSHFTATTTNESNFVGGIASNGWTHSTTTTVCASGCEYTSIQTALNDGYLNVVLKDETYSEQITIQNANTTIRGENIRASTIQANGSTQSPAVDFDGNNFVSLRDLSIVESGGATEGVGVDIENSAHFDLQNVSVSGYATGTVVHDSSNTTFYGNMENVRLFDNTSCLEVSGTLANDNSVDRLRCRPASGEGGIGITLLDARGWTFTGANVEPANGTGITGVRIGTTTREITFVNPWIESTAGTGVEIMSGANRTTFLGGTVTGWGTDVSDDGTNSVFINTNETGSLLQQFGVTDFLGDTDTTPEISIKEDGGGGTNAGPILELRQQGDSINGSDDSQIGKVNFTGNDISGSETGIGAQIKGIATGFWNGTTNDYPSALTFSTNPDGSTGLTERMRIDQDGKVGIASSTPYAQLSVTNTGSDPSFIVEDSASPDSSPFIVDASGQVGVKNNSPSTDLHVLGQIAAGVDGGIGSGYMTIRTDQEEAISLLRSATGSYDIGITNGGGFFVEDSDTSTKQMVLVDGDDASGGNLGLLDNTPDARLEIAASSNEPYLYLSSSDSGDGDIFSVLNNGNVGIGTTSPQAKLGIGSAGNGILFAPTATSTLDNHLKINGNLEVVGNSFDHIFSDWMDGETTDATEVETFVRDKGHLPYIDKHEEEETGLNVARLMGQIWEAVERAWIVLFEHEDRLDRLENRLDKLEEENKELKRKLKTNVCEISWQNM